MAEFRPDVSLSAGGSLQVFELSLASKLRGCARAPDVQPIDIPGRSASKRSQLLFADDPPRVGYDDLQHVPAIRAERSLDAF